jgi:apolipoprotein N-acyltransferase
VRPVPKLSHLRVGHVTLGRLPTGIAAVLAAVSGWVLDAAFPDLEVWPLAFVGTALLLAAVRGLNFWQGLLVGAIGGFAYYGILIWWLTVYLGPIPWIALTLAQVFFFSLGMGLIALTWSITSQWWTSVAGRLGLVPVLIAGVWTLREAIAAVWPFGGFAWGRLAQSQTESPFAPLVAWVGQSGLSFVVAWLSALAVALIVEWRVSAVNRLALAVASVTALMVWPAYPWEATDSIRVAAVQGNADAGLFADYDRGDNLRDHHAVTQRIYGEEVDVVVWPENASDLDPLRYPDAAKIADEVVREMGAPLVVGTITQAGEETFNSILLWDIPEGALAGRAIDQYDKIHPVPFAEYLPARDFFYPLAPDLFDMVPRDYSFGTRDTVFSVAGHTAGIAICYDIVDDAIFWQMMDEGADIIFAPTNNADFGRTDQSVQQLAIARLRAIETGRTVVNISTVGTSAIIDPSGVTLDRLPTYTEGYMVMEVPTTSHTTPATRFGRTIELSVSALGLIGLGLAWWASASVKNHYPTSRSDTKRSRTPIARSARSVTTPVAPSK